MGRVGAGLRGPRRPEVPKLGRSPLHPQNEGLAYLSCRGVGFASVGQLSWKSSGVKSFPSIEAGSNIPQGVSRAFTQRPSIIETATALLEAGASCRARATAACNTCLHPCT